MASFATTGRQFAVAVFAALLSLALAGCVADGPGNASTAVDGVPANSDAPAADEPVASGSQDRAKPPDPIDPKVLASVMVAEAAAQQENYDEAARLYWQAAQQSEDPEIAERATRIALFQRDLDLAQQAVARWIALEPDEPQARQTAAMVALQQRDLDTSVEMLSFLIQLDEEWVKLAEASGQPDLAAGWSGVSSLLALVGDGSFVDEVVTRLGEELNQPGRALYLKSQFAAARKDFDTAVELADSVLAAEPNWAEAQRWRARLALAEDDLATAADQLRSMAEPDRQVALALAEGYYQQDQVAKADAVLAKLPDDALALFTRAYYAHEQGQIEKAQNHYAALRDLPEDTPRKAFLTAQVADLLGETDQALRLYGQVPAGNDYVQAQLRQAALEADQGDLAKARSRLRLMQNAEVTTARHAIILEADLLREAGRGTEGLEVITRGLNLMPGDSDLLYARALLAASVDDLERAESDLRELLETDPDNPDVLNALGYTLADRTQRFDEALGLIQRALEMAPESAAIIDSMGWVNYRLGNLDAATEYLKQAYDLAQDAEIAAHYGEVLWVQGEESRAREIWRQALDDAPDHPVLNDTIDRLAGDSL